MARGVLAFLILWLVAFGGLATWRQWSIRSAWSVAKTIGLSGLAALIVFIILAVFVALF